MSADSDRSASAERALGAELVRAAETMMARAGADLGDVPAAMQRRTVDVLLALYWALRQELPDPAANGGTRLRRLASDPGD